MGARTMVSQPTCFHDLSDESVALRWEQVERQIMAVPENDRDAQVLALQWCACCCGPAKAELCSRCQCITPEQFATLMGMRAEKAGAA